MFLINGNQLLASLSPQKPRAHSEMPRNAGVINPNKLRVISFKTAADQYGSDYKIGRLQNLKLLSDILPIKNRRASFATGFESLITLLTPYPQMPVQSVPLLHNCA